MCSSDLDGVTPASLLSLATEAGLSLITRFFQTLAEDRVPTLDRSQSWGSRKTTRKMFRELCRIDPDMPLQEFERRFRAAAMPGYGNLYIDLHGHRFHIEASPT